MLRLTMWQEAQAPVYPLQDMVAKILADAGEFLGVFKFLRRMHNHAGHIEGAIVHHELMASRDKLKLVMSIISRVGVYPDEVVRVDANAHCELGLRRPR